MNDLKLLFLNDYIITGIIWGIWALYMQHRIYKKNYFITWFLNTIFWPIAISIAVYKLVKYGEVK